jgi:hypothetical protein
MLCRQTALSVMAGLVPAIHAAPFRPIQAFPVA